MIQTYIIANRKQTVATKSVYLNLIKKWKQMRPFTARKLILQTFTKLCWYGHRINNIVVKSMVYVCMTLQQVVDILS